MILRKQKHLFEMLDVIAEDVDPRMLAVLVDRHRWLWEISACKSPDGHCDQIGKGRVGEGNRGAARRTKPVGARGSVALRARPF